MNVSAASIIRPLGQSQPCSQHVCTQIKHFQRSRQVVSYLMTPIHRGALSLRLNIKKNPAPVWQNYHNVMSYGWGLLSDNRRKCAGQCGDEREIIPRSKDPLTDCGLARREGEEIQLKECYLRGEDPEALLKVQCQEFNIQFCILPHNRWWCCPVSFSTLNMIGFHNTALLNQQLASIAFPFFFFFFCVVRFLFVSVLPLVQFSKSPLSFLFFFWNPNNPHRGDTEPPPAWTEATPPVWVSVHHVMQICT